MSRSLSVHQSINSDNYDNAISLSLPFPLLQKSFPAYITFVLETIGKLPCAKSSVIIFKIIAGNPFPLNRPSPTHQVNYFQLENDRLKLHVSHSPLLKMTSKICIMSHHFNNFFEGKILFEEDVLIIKFGGAQW